MADARRGKFNDLLVWACGRLARSVTYFLKVLDELNHLGIEFVSFREQLDTGGPLGRAVVVIISAIAELERNLIVERARAGLLRTRLHGRRLGRPHGGSRSSAPRSGTRYENQPVSHAVWHRRNQRAPPLATVPIHPAKNLLRTAPAGR